MADSTDNAENRADPFTLTMRLCDDEGMVSDAPVDDPRTPRTHDKSYRERLNRLRAMSRTLDPLKPYTGPAFSCTGNAHLAGEHILCTSPAHTSLVAEPFDLLADQGDNHG